jgi:murein L,D-transpeptidase YcbB/YkuD
VARSARSCHRPWTTLLAIALGYGCGSPEPSASQELAPEQAPDPGAIADEIRFRVASAGGTPVPVDREGGATAALVELYQDRGFAPLWTDAARTELRRVVGESWRDGLDPSDYFHRELVLGAQRPPTAAGLAELDVLSTAALAALARDLAWGRAPELRDDGQPSRAIEPATLRGLIASDSLAAAIDRMRPSHYFYRGLMAGVGELRNIAAQGGWDSIPAGPPLRIGEPDPRLPLLRRRLATEGYLPERSGDPLQFDVELEGVVRTFQHRHGLNEDGIVGASTLAALNVPVERRLDQLRVNLERARWVLAGLPDTFVVVNVAGAKAYMVRGDGIALESRVVIGRSYTKTPILRATIRQVVLNPTWTVPTGIVDEVLAEIRRDSRYLSREGMRVLDHSGTEIDPATVDFARWSGRTFPYVFQQDAGPRNPLGRIKLLFPNPHDVYLHDTPAPTLFEREERAFSHGCIRVQDPLRLAELVLDDPAWSAEKLSAEIARGSQRTIELRRPVEVIVQYWTASADAEGVLHYYRDAYGRDDALLAALDG